MKSNYVMLKHSSLQRRPSVVISRVAVRSRRSTVIAILTAAMILPFCAESAQSVYVSTGPGSYDDHRKDQVFKDKPNDTDYVCASTNPAGPYTPLLGRPCDYFLWANIPSTQSIATCDISSGSCKNQNGGIETYVVKASISGSTPTPPVVVPPTSGDGTATMTWTAPTLGTDKNPIAPITGYNLYYGTNPASLAKVSLPATPLSYTLTNLASGTYYFAMTTCASDCSKGNESDRTNLASKLVQGSIPLPIPPPVLPPPAPPSPQVIVTEIAATWSLKKGSTNIDIGLIDYAACKSAAVAKAMKTETKFNCVPVGGSISVRLP